MLATVMLHVISGLYKPPSWYLLWLFGIKCFIYGRGSSEWLILCLILAIYFNAWSNSHQENVNVMFDLTFQNAFCFYLLERPRKPSNPVEEGIGLRSATSSVSVAAVASALVFCWLL